MKTLASRLSGLFLPVELRSLSKGPGEPQKAGSGVADPEQTVRSMLVVGGLAAGLGWWAALAGRVIGQ